MNSLNKTKGTIAALVSSGTFGMIPLFSIPLMQAGMNTTSVLLYRYIISAVAIFALLMFKKQSIRISLKAAGKLFALSAFYAGTAVALLVSYKYVPSGIVTTIHFMYPVVVVGLTALFYREKLSWRLLLTSILAVVGVGFLSVSGGGKIHPMGLAIAASTAISYALYVVGLRDKDVSELKGPVVTFYMLIFGALLFFVANRVAEPVLSIVPDSTAWVNLLLLSLFPTIISILTLVTAVKYIGATTASILGAAEPLVAMLVGVTVFSEHFTLFSLVGLMIIITAVTYVILLTNREKEPEKVKVPVEREKEDARSRIEKRREK